MPRRIATERCKFRRLGGMKEALGDRLPVLQIARLLYIDAHREIVRDRNEHDVAGMREVEFERLAAQNGFAGVMPCQVEVAVVPSERRGEKDPQTGMSGNEIVPVGGTAEPVGADRFIR